MDLRILKACGLSAALMLVGSTSFAESLNQAGLQSGGDTFQFGFASIPNLQISNAPSDTDYNRSAMLHDGSAYRLYFFKEGSEDTLYQFAYNGSNYQYGHNSIAQLRITNKPADANPEDFAMLHDGSVYRLYMLSYDQTKVYQFGWNGSTYEYGHRSIPSISITGAPSDADKSRWAMLHDGQNYRLYFAKQGVTDKIYAFAWNGSSYQFGFDSPGIIDLDLVPTNSNFDIMNMLHDGSRSRFYYLAP
jgi:hypothetical protein